MEKHIIDVFVPHKKLRKLYYLSAFLLAGLWLPDLNKLNIPLPSKVFETWFLDKLLLTTIVLMLMYSFSAYFLSRISATTQKAPPESKPITTTKTEKLTLSESHINILELLFAKPSTVENLCKVLKLNREEVKYYLTDLCDDKCMIDPPSAYAPGPEEWRIDQKGREYVMAHRVSEKTARDAWNVHT